MASTVSAEYASYSISNPYSLTSVPSSAGEYIALFYNLGGYTVTSLSTSISERGSCRFEDDISVQTQVEIWTAEIDSSTGKAYLQDYITEKLEDWWIPANSSSSQTTNVSISLNRSFEENTGICLRIVLALPTITGGSASATISSMPRLTVEGTAGGGGSGTDPGTGGGGSTTPTTPRNPPVSATPSSPSGSSTVTPGKSTNFSWRISKYLDTTAYAGSELQYRYGGNGRTYTLGNTQYDITTLTYPNGFSSNSIVQWRVRTGITAADGYYYLNSLLTEAGYDLDILESEGYEWSGGVFYSKWSDWVSFQTGDYEPEPEPEPEPVYSANVSIVTPSGGQYSGTESIPFVFEVSSQASFIQYEAQYTVNNGVSWEQLISNSTSSSSFEVHFEKTGFPEGTVKWRARAKANGDWSNWATASFDVKYNGYGQIVVTFGPVNQPCMGAHPFFIEAGHVVVGEVGTTVKLKEATFCWRSGESNNFSEIAMDPYPAGGIITEYRLRLESYALPYGIIQWYLKGTDTKDNESETDLYTTYILRSPIDSFALSPLSSIENVENQIEFKWAYISEDNKSPSKAEFQFSDDGVRWKDLTEVNFAHNTNNSIVVGELPDDPMDVYTGIKTCRFISEYFRPGRLYWRVRCYDSTNHVGEYSDSVSFIAYGTPKVRNFICDAKPFATLTWDAIGQVSYEIKIDDQLYYGPFHGTDGRFILPEPLEDGTHTIAVQVQNTLGLFTPWSEISVEIENIPSEPDPHELFITGELDAAISWNPLSVRQADEFLLYRDHNLIKKFESNLRNYTDRLVLGLHTYEIIQHMPNGYYNRYTHPSIFLSTDITKIAFLDGGPWLSLILTSESYPTNTFKRTRLVEKTKILGATYPVVEIGDFEEQSAQYEVVWPFEEREKADQFKQFFGKTVIIKSRGEQAICGILDNYEIAVNSQVVSLTFTLEQINVEDSISIGSYRDVYGSFYTDLDRIAFGEMSVLALAAASTNPGITDPQSYELIAEAINELKKVAKII